MNVPTFTQIDSDYVFEPVVQLVTQDAIDRFALGSMDMNPVHTNTEWAERAQVFGTPLTVAHGMLTMSNTTSVVTRQWGVINSQGGRIRFVDVKFTKVVKVGETVTATAKIKRKHYDGPGKNWVEIGVQAKDSDGEIVAVTEIGYSLPD